VKSVQREIGTVYARLFNPVHTRRKTDEAHREKERRGGGGMKAVWLKVQRKNFLTILPDEVTPLYGDHNTTGGERGLVSLLDKKNSNWSDFRGKKRIIKLM